MEGRRNGLTPIEVYSNLEEGQGLQGAEGDLKTRIIDQLVTGCEERCGSGGGGSGGGQRGLAESE
jgi:hypothetical protein